MQKIVQMLAKMIFVKIVSWINSYFRIKNLMKIKGIFFLVSNKDNQETLEKKY